MSADAPGSPRPATTLFFEDFVPGDVFELGTYEVTAEEIIDFGRRYDPQAFHVDPAAAAHSAFGGLVASGWHTAAILMRLYVDAVLLHAASMGSPGVEEVRWLVPVRPGDVLAGRVTILDARPSARRADRGTVRMLSELLHGHQVVMRMTGRALFGRQPT